MVAVNVGSEGSSVGFTVAEARTVGVSVGAWVGSEVRVGSGIVGVGLGEGRDVEVGVSVAGLACVPVQAVRMRVISRRDEKRVEGSFFIYI